MSSRRFIIPLLIALCVLAYANSFRAGFHFDDYRLIRFNFPAHAGSAWTSIVRYDRYRPLLLATFALNYRFANQNPFGYHVVNAGLHGICVLLFYLWLRRMAANTLYAVVAAAFMAVHPLNTEAVTYIAGRSIVLCAVFYLSAMLFADSYLRNGRGMAIYLYFACFFLAALIKEEAAAIPLAVLLYNYILFGIASVRAHRLFHVLSLVPLALGLVLRSATLPQSPYSFLQYWSAQPVVWLRYIALALYPVGQNVDPDIKVPGFAGFTFSITLCASAAIVFLLLKAKRRAPIMAFWGIWFFLNLLPSAIIPLNDLMAEHRVYLSMFGFCGALAYVLFEMLTSRFIGSRVAAALVVLLLVFYGAATYQRNQVWDNEFTLWYDAVQKSPDKPRTHLNLAGAYIEKRAYGKAIAEYGEARRLGGEAPEIYSGLGICAYQTHDWNKAEEYFRKGIELDPQHVDSRAGLALVLYREKKYEEALPHLEAVYPLRQESPALLAMLANCYFKTGQEKRARAIAERLRKLK